MKPLIVAIAAALSVLAGSPSWAQDRPVPGYGAFTPLPQAGEQPEAGRLYEVVFDISASGPEGRPSPGLDRVARFVNLLAAGGVDADHRRLVVVVHGGATPALLSNQAWAARHAGATNPNADLVAQLIAAGVDVRVCGQAMTGHGIAPEELATGVKLDLAALMGVVHLQQRGYALVPD